jgi:hypothetical protein
MSIQTFHKETPYLVGLKYKYINKIISRVLVARAYNPRYLGG